MSDSEPVPIAARQLLEELSPKRLHSQASLARELGVTTGAVNNWCHGRGRPSPELMAKIQDLLGVPMRAWLEYESEPSEPNGDAA